MQINQRIIFLAGLILLAAVFRILPHPPNFAPITAMALFGGACIADRRLALLLPLSAMFISDMILGLHSQMLVVYVSFIAIAGIGMLLRNHVRPVLLICASLSGSLVFFTLTNFSVWLIDGLYPLTVDGLQACYVAAIPFLQNAVLGDLIFVTAIFGALKLAEQFKPALREPILTVG